VTERVVAIGGKLPKVGILLAIHNGERFLESQVFSLLQQEGVDLHVFAYDDNSSDRSRLILDRLQFNNPSAITILSPTRAIGGSAAKSFFGMLLALPMPEIESFEFWAYADQDDLWLSTKLRKAVAKLIDYHADGYSSNLYYFDETGKRAGVLRKRDKSCRYDHLFQAASAGCTYVLSSLAASIIRSSLRDCYELLPEGASHDWLSYTICKSAGLTWFHDPRSFVLYRQHSANVHGFPPLIARTVSKAKRLGWYKNNIRFALSISSKLRPNESFAIACLHGGRRKRIAVLRNWHHLRREPTKALFLAVLMMVGLV
jgi:rhamnosyltransferase